MAYQKKDCCEYCSYEYDLEAHHQDCNHKNNDPDNLITLCKGCHIKEHRVLDGGTEVLSAAMCQMLDFIIAFQNENGRTPSNNEIGEAMEYKNSSVGTMLRKIELRGAIKRSFVRHIEIVNYDKEV